ncbi:MAG: uroporphyrinogen decarboxylase family protein [Candidatus Fimivivens sp.]
MNREERIKAALNSMEVDRVPISVWMHFSEFDQDPRSLAECMVHFNEKYDYDFIKMMPFGAYSVSDWGAKLDVFCDKYKEVVISAPGINSVADYNTIEPLPPIFGTWGKQLLLTQHMSRISKPHTPYIQTIFTPATTLRKLAGERLLEDMNTHPEAVHNALEAITQTTIDFIRANIEAGVSGFFLASQCATYDYMTDALYAEFCKPYDFRVINSYKDATYFNVMHVHGSNIMFDTVLSYPVNCINWHDRHTEPDMQTARTKTSKAFLGGILEVPTIIKGVLQYDSILARSTPEEIGVHIKEAIDMVDGRGLIIGPGCVADPHTPEANLAAVRAAVEKRYQTV